MDTKLEKFNSGWVGVSIALSEEEIDVLIQKLNQLKNDQVKHFHFRNEDFNSEEGVADIEITMINEKDDNMIIE